MARLKLDVTRGLIVLNAELRSGRRSTFVNVALDTGATTTILPPDKMLRIGINPAKAKERMRVITGSGWEFCPRVTIPKMIVAGYQVRNLEAYCHVLPEKSPVEGLLGLNFLRHFDLRLNFKKGILEIR